MAMSSTRLSTMRPTTSGKSIQTPVRSSIRETLQNDRAGDARAQGAGTNRVEIGRVLSLPGTADLVVGTAFVNNFLYTFSEAGVVVEINPNDLNANPNPTGVNVIGQFHDNVPIPGGRVDCFGDSGACWDHWIRKRHPALDFDGGTLIAYDPVAVDVVEVLNRSNSTIETDIVGPTIADVQACIARTFGISRTSAITTPDTAGQQPAKPACTSETSPGPMKTPTPQGSNAHGQLESEGFDLSEYSPEDVPMLYFNYFLETEDLEGLLNTNAFARDTLRVFVSSEQDRTWTSVATNNGAQTGTFNDPGTPAPTTTYDEFDVGVNGYREPDGRGYIARELHDNTDGWLQARIPLAPWAGHNDVRIRFDFNTAGESERFVTEIRAAAANVILDAPKPPIHDPPRS